MNAHLKSGTYDCYYFNMFYSGSM